jgi:hypothetical protein
MKLGQDRLIPHPFQFFIQYYPAIALAINSIVK